MSRLILGSLLVFVSLAAEAHAMTAEPTRVVLYRRGEAIGGEEFLAANEAIVDYLATLPRPTEVLKAYKYTCLVKSRLIRPSVIQMSGGTTNNGYVPVRMVYELKDCVEARD